jgi:hypothetical protein
MNSSSKSSKSAAPTSARTVSEIQVNKTAQMVQAGKSATFVLTATTSTGQAASNLPVTVYIGPMVPLGSGVSTWYNSASGSAKTYLDSFSHTTNSSGQATITLSGQPAKSMEMVGVKIGSFQSFNPQTMKGAGLLDAWWTTSATVPTAPVGDYVVVKPFAVTVKPGASQTLTVTAMSPAGPISGASVLVTPKSATSSSSSMGSSSSNSMSSTGGTTLMTNASGQVSYVVKTGSTAMAALPVRFVVSQGMGRVAGGMNAEVVTN